MKKGRYIHFVPSEYQKSVKNIDFLHLYQEGFRVIFIDIDNTLVSYKEHHLTEDLIGFLNQLEQTGFKIVLISNNKQARVETFVGDHAYKFVYSAKKPLKRGFRKGLKLVNETNTRKVVHIGDQVMTDILGGNRMGFYTILVSAIERKSDILPTRINRKMEAFFIKKVKKHQPELYEKRLLPYVETL
ncbi:YqeG family HAD IIIA-type phosphatase [Acholeplasma vituli]|uniref:YqeG family HAD IIIA-type phosphatase n=1 Tax=Paracholeplasma vituli TaxID=69473 RepID=A0ABT2PWU4_9MOLU|nr:YqeG family HAD IIIA-type phosphatase [Paracholeplasma vituli]MCU0105387.1 YqeG family HAD IIIA-type phosphatase [Paracholeplasma vituli]